MKKNIFLFLFPLILFFATSFRVDAYDYTDDLATIIGGILSDVPKLDTLYPNSRVYDYDNVYEQGHIIQGGHRITVATSFVDSSDGTCIRFDTINSSDGFVNLFDSYVVSNVTMDDALSYCEERHEILNSTSTCWNDSDFTNHHRNLFRFYSLVKASDLVDCGFLVKDSNNQWIFDYSHYQDFLLVEPIYRSLPDPVGSYWIKIQSGDRNNYNGVYAKSTQQLLFIGHNYTGSSSDWSNYVSELVISTEHLGQSPQSYTEDLTAPIVDLKMNFNDPLLGHKELTSIYFKFGLYRDDVDIECRYNISKYYDYIYDSDIGEIVGMHPKSLYQSYSKSIFINSSDNEYWDDGVATLTLGKDMHIDQRKGFLQDIYHDELNDVDSFSYDNNIKAQRKAAAKALTSLKSFYNPYVNFVFQFRFVSKDRTRASKWVECNYNPFETAGYQYSSSGYFTSDPTSNEDIDWFDGRGGHLNYDYDSDGNSEDIYNNFSDNPDKSIFEFLLDKLGVGKLTNGFSQMFDTLGGVIKTIINGIGSVPYLIAQVFSWLPSWFSSLFACSIALVIILRILGR